MFVTSVIFCSKIFPLPEDKLCKIYSADFHKEILNFKKGVQHLFI